MAQKTVDEADLVEVLNKSDVQILKEAGVPGEKIFLTPNGLERNRSSAFKAVSSSVPPGQPRVAFVGTFDLRKGMRDFPLIWTKIVRSVPKARLKLLGTFGLVEDVDGVLRTFPSALRDTIEVHPRFDGKDLPNLLSDCWVGAFPSYIEGFGIGVLEMLAASIPVIAYDSPGPPEMLSSTSLVPCGDVDAMACSIVALLSDRKRLETERRKAADIASNFTWEFAAKMTDQVYRDALLKKILAPSRRDL